MTEMTVIREEFQNDMGGALVLTRRIPEGPRGLHALEEEPLEKRLEFVKGVGPQMRGRLNASGYQTLLDLARHPRFGKGATRVWAALAKRDARALLSAGARDIELMPLFRREETVVVDIETTGLAQSLPVFLIGVAYGARDCWEVRQYLARGFEEEAAILRQVALEMQGRKACVSYNGKAFDEPFVKARFRFHGLSPLVFTLHVDLLHTCRRRFGAMYPNCRLTTMAEGLLGLVRHHDVSGEEVPDLYYRFVRDGDEEAIAPVIEHNAADLKALAWLLDSFTVDVSGGSEENGAAEGKAAAAWDQPEGGERGAG